MDIVHPANATRILGVPPEWDSTKQGACSALPIIDYKDDAEQPWMMSVWRPSAEDLAMLNAGHGLSLHVLGTSHPVVGLGLTELPLTDEPNVS